MINKIKLYCINCKNFNYVFKKPKVFLKNRLELKKYCKKCKNYFLHKENW